MKEIYLEMKEKERENSDLSSIITSKIPNQDEQDLVKKQNTSFKPLEDEYYKSLSPEEIQIIDDLASEIDIDNIAQIIHYGITAQNHMSEFTDGVLRNIRTKDTGEIGELISKLVGNINSYDSEIAPKKGLARLFSNSKKEVELMIAKFKNLESNIDTIKSDLENKSVVLNKDVALMEKLFNKNLLFYKELTLYILAGKKKLAELYNVALPELINKVQMSSEPFYSQQLDDLKNKIGRLEKRVYDLELTRQISIQTAPQIRMLQNNDMILIEKIQSTIINTIPLWKNQMIIALGINHAEEAAATQRAITNLTNSLLTKNAEQLKIASVAVAKENERGIVDIETLKKTNQTIISTISEIIDVQNKGREHRQTAEKELLVLENELKQKILESCNYQSPIDDYDSNPTENEIDDKKGPTLRLR